MKSDIVKRFSEKHQNTSLKQVEVEIRPFVVPPGALCNRNYTLRRFNYDEKLTIYTALHVLTIPYLLSVDINKNIEAKVSFFQ